MTDENYEILKSVPRLDQEIEKRILEQYAEFERYREKFVFKDLNPNESELSYPASHVMEMAEYLEPSKPVLLHSHRPVIGHLIIFIKHAIMRTFHPFLKICLSRQTTFNNFVWALAHSTVALEARVKELEKEISDLKKGI